MGTARTETNVKCVNVSVAMRIIILNELKTEANQVL